MMIYDVIMTSWMKLKSVTDCLTQWLWSGISRVAFETKYFPNISTMYGRYGVRVTTEECSIAVFVMSCQCIVGVIIQVNISQLTHFNILTSSTWLSSYFTTIMNNKDGRHCPVNFDIFWFFKTSLRWAFPFRCQDCTTWDISCLLLVFMA